MSSQSFKCVGAQEWLAVVRAEDHECRRAAAVYCYARFSDGQLMHTSICHRELSHSHDVDAQVTQHVAGQHRIAGSGIHKSLHLTGFLSRETCDG